MNRDPAHRLRPVDFDFWWPQHPEVSWQVLGVRGREEISTPYEFEIELICDDPMLDADELLGADCELLLDRNGLTRVFFGVVAEVDFVVAPTLERELDGAAVRVRLVPALRMLEQDIDTRFFMGQTVIEVLREVLGAALAAWGRELDVESRISGQYNRRDYCVQFRESTFAFCSRLMEEEGIAYVFVPDHEGQRETLVLIDDNAGFTAVELLVPGGIPIVPTAPEEVDRETLQSFEWRRKRTPNRVVTRGYNPKVPAQRDSGQAQRHDRGRSVPTEQYLDGERRQIIDDPVADPEAQSFTGAELDQRASMAVRALQRHTLEAGCGLGRANAIGFAAGGTFELAEPHETIGAEPLLIVRVDHHASATGELSATHDAYSNRFECVPRSRPFRPASRTPRPKVYGVQTGVVVGRTADEVYTDPLGRVRVEFHRERAKVDGEHASCWIPVAQIWAGNGYGAMVIPRVGMEVVVSFIDGNPDCPLVTGTIYNGGNAPPYPLPSELSKSTLKTRSLGGDGFNELRIEDQDGREQIFVHAQRRMDLRVRGVLYETSAGGREEVIGAPDPEATPDHHHNTLVHGQRNERVDASRFALIQQYDFQTVLNRIDEVEEDHLEFVGNRSQLNAAQILVEASDFICHTANKLEAAGSSAVSIKAGEHVVIESNNRIELVVGQSFIALTPIGIEIGGATISLNSGGGPTERASDGTPAVESYMLEPLDALVADDGRLHKGGGGGRRKHRHHSGHPLTPQHAPPMEPKKPERPDPDRPANARVLELRWGAPEAWCSESALLLVRCEGYDGSTSETLLIDNDVDGATQYSDVVQPIASDCSFGIEIVDVIPRKIGDGVESERLLQASLANVKTVTPIRLRFLTEVPQIRYKKSYARFDLGVSNREVTVGGTIEYTRGWIFYIIRLGDLVPEDTGGIIGGKYDGSKDWRYCKASDDGGRYVYWNGVAWVDVPKGWSDPIGTKLSGMAVWREGNEVKTQFGKKPWPDPVPGRWTDETIHSPEEIAEGFPERFDSVEDELQRWADLIAQYWSGQMDLQRVECRGRAPDCCRFRVRCAVSFVETDRKGQGIILAQNDARANASAWPYASDDETVLHEYGHHLGNPDEYEGASTVDPTVNGDGAKAGIDEHGLMGSGTVFRRRYYNSICKALARAVAQHTGKSYSYKAVELLRGGE